MTRKDRAAKSLHRTTGAKRLNPRPSGALAKFLGSRVGQALITEAVIAGVALIARYEVKRRGEKHRGKPARALKRAGDGHVSPAPASLKFAISEAARAFTAALKGSQALPAAASPDDDWPADFERPRPRTRQAHAEAFAANPH